MSDLLRILVSPVMWLASFSAVYGLMGLVCAPRAPFGGTDWPWGRVLLVAGFALAVLLQIALLVALRSRRFGAPPGFVRHVSLTSGWVGLGATVWTLMPVLATTACP